MPRRTACYHVQLTVRERDTLLAHVEPAGALDAIFIGAHVVGPLVNLELDAEGLDELLDHLNATAGGAQNESAMDLLGQAVVRLESGFDGTTDPGWHMLRPAMVRLDFTPRQGQYLAFIHLYTRLHRRPPAHSDIQVYFQTSPPVVNETLKALKRKGFISTQSREARSIRVLVPPMRFPSSNDAWKQGKNTPGRPAARLLEIAESHPEVVLASVRSDKPLSTYFGTNCRL